MSLASIAQDDFAAGMLRGLAPDVQPGVGVYNAVNGFFNDDGDVYRRGGTHYASNALPGPITHIWTGYLNQLPVTLLSTHDKLYTLGGLTPVELGAPGLPGPVLGAVVGDHLYLPNGVMWDGGGAVTAWPRPASLPGTDALHVAACAGRLVVASGNHIAFSEADNPASFIADDFHVLPGGVLVIGMAALRDTLLVFTNYGLWSITNMAFDLTDAAGNIQQSLSLLTPEISLWHESGLAEWHGVIIAPCVTRTFLVDGLSAPVPITDSIPRVYMDYVRLGYRPGGAKVFRAHYFLPLLDVVTGLPMAVLVCRLDRPVRGRLTYYPWSTLTGHPAQMIAGDVSLITNAPRFLLAGADGRVADFSDCLNPDEDCASDADGTAFEFDVETRDFPTGSGQPNHVRAVRLRYTLDGAATIDAGYSYGSLGQTYGDIVGSTYADVEAAYPDYGALARGPGWSSGFPPTPEEPNRFWYRLEGQTPPTPGLDPVMWRLPVAKRVRFIRWRFRCTDPVARLVLHHVDFAVRSAAHDR